MRFCFFIANFLPNLGGVERYTHNLSKKLIQKGHHVTVITSNVFDLQEQETLDGIEIYRLPCINLLGGRFPVLKPNIDFFRLNKVLLSKDYDLAIIQSRFYVHCAYGIHFAKKKHLPRLVLEHGTNHFTVNNPVLDRLGAAYEHLITSYIRRRCNQYYGVSQACCDWLTHFHIQASGKLYNAVDMRQISQLLSAPVDDYRQSLDLGSNIIVTYTGRLVKEKGIQKLLDAMDLLETDGFFVTLLVAGNGPLYENLRQENRKNLVLLGLLDFPSIISLLKQTDIFCLPTDYPEGFPTSVLEAAACGCYVVTTNKGGSKELILDNSYGMILKENTPQAIANAIKSAIITPSVRHTAGQTVQRRVQENFTWDAVSDELIKIASDQISL